MSYYVTKFTPWIETKKKNENPVETTQYTWRSATKLRKKNRDCFL